VGRGCRQSLTPSTIRVSSGRGRPAPCTWTAPRVSSTSVEIRRQRLHAISRQQDVLVALVKKLAAPNTALKFQQVLGMAGNAIQTTSRSALPRTTRPPWIVPVRHCLSASWGRRTAGTRQLHQNGAWTSRLNLNKVANLSVKLFGTESSYYGQAE